MPTCSCGGGPGSLVSCIIQHFAMLDTADKAPGLQGADYLVGVGEGWRSNTSQTLHSVVKVQNAGEVHE